MVCHYNGFIMFFGGDGGVRYYLLSSSVIVLKPMLSCNIKEWCEATLHWHILPIGLHTEEQRTEAYRE